MQKKFFKIEDQIEALKPLLDSVEYTNDDGMKEIENITQDILGRIIFSMRKTKEFNFFAVFLDKINLIVEPELPSAAACTFKRNKFEILFNPFIAFKFDKELIRAFIIHELYHIIFNHIKRGDNYFKRSKVSHECINIGLDASINQYIKELKDNELFITLNTIKELSGGSIVKAEQNCEYYIDLIKDNPKMAKQDFTELLDKIKDILNSNSNGSGSENNNGNNESSVGDSNDSSSTQNDDSDDNRGNKVVKDYDLNHDFNFKNLEDLQGQADIQENILKELLREVSSKSRGLMPAGVSSVMDQLFQEPIIRWQDVLKQYIGRLPVPFKKTSSRLSRRMPYRLDIMGKLPDAYYKILIGLDTSGSMSDKDIQLCLNEVWHIVQNQKKRFEIVVAECDAKVQSVYHIKKKDDFKKIKVKGRGGTSFSPVFEWLRENRKKYGRDTVVIFFTDGYGETNLSFNVNKLVSNRLIWVLTGNVNDLSLADKRLGRRLEMRLNDIKNRRN